MAILRHAMFTEIGSREFIVPRAVMTSDPYPLRRSSEYAAVGPVLASDVTISANATLLSAVQVGEAAGFPSEVGSSDA